MITPSDAPVSVQRALLDLEARIAFLEDKKGVDVGEEIERLREELSPPPSPTFLNEKDIFVGAGAGGVHGLVPSPGVYTGLDKCGIERVLHEDGNWKPPLEGVLRPVPSTIGSSAQRTLNLLGSLAITSDIEAHKAYLKDLQVLGKMSFTPPSCRVFNSAGQSVTLNQYNYLTFNSERWDTDEMHSTSSNTSRITCNTAGKYLVGGHIQTVSTSAHISVWLNRTTIYGLHSYSADGAQVHLVTLIGLVVGDYVELAVYPGASGTVGAAAAYTPEFWAHWVGN